MKRNICLSLISLLLLLFSLPVSASTQKVYDSANLFTASEVQKIESTISSISTQYNIDVGIVTTNQTNGKSSRDYADDFYDTNGYGIGAEHSGLLLLINMQNREVYISTTGIAIDYFTDSRIQTMLDHIYKELGNGNYFLASSIFLNDVQTYMTKGIPSNHQRVGPMTTQDYFLRGGIALGIGVIIGGIACMIVYYRYKNPPSHPATSYLSRDSFQITSQKDEFIRTYTTKVKIQRNDNSTTHTSSSGQSHGGGGRKF